ncbi:MAG: ribosomal-processing cysteine protease Prp [Clostridia bacterium]|nr:ribosomal-processing cysteine protease Prp [Clostridia bacterium]
MSKDTIVGFAINGHDTPDADSGVSLVCAAVSSAVYMTVNAVTDVCGVDPLVLETGDGLMTLRLRREDAEVCQILLKGLKLHLESLAADYNTIITVTITEV